MAAKKNPNARHLALLQSSLAFLLPGEQAEKLARTLWNSWGSLTSLATAPTERLMEVPGMTEAVAGYLQATLELAKACLDEQHGGIRRVAGHENAADLLRPLFLGRRTEAVGVLLLDSGSKLIYRGIVSDGAIGMVPIYIRRLAGICIDYNADSIILCHNHVSGNATPSQQDMLTTKQLEMIMRGIQVQLRDHIILADDSIFSFAYSGVLRQMLDENLEERREQLQEARKAVREIQSEQ